MSGSDEESRGSGSGRDAGSGCDSDVVAFAMPQPALLLPGASIEETDLDTELESMDRLPATSLGRTPTGAQTSNLQRGESIRGAVLAPAINTVFSHPSTEGPDDTRLLPSSVVLPKNFSLRGALMHAFISYRVATEGMVLISLRSCALLHSRPLSPRRTSRTPERTP